MPIQRQPQPLSINQDQKGQKLDKNRCFSINLVHLPHVHLYVCICMYKNERKINDRRNEIKMLKSEEEKRVMLICMMYACMFNADIVVGRYDISCHIKSCHVE